MIFDMHEALDRVRDASRRFHEAGGRGRAGPLLTLIVQFRLVAASCSGACEVQIEGAWSAGKVLALGVSE
jgi:hypothetical protein